MELAPCLTRLLPWLLLWAITALLPPSIFLACTTGRGSKGDAMRWAPGEGSPARRLTVAAGAERPAGHCCGAQAPVQARRCLQRHLVPPHGPCLPAALQQEALCRSSPLQQHPPAAPARWGRRRALPACCCCVRRQSWRLPARAGLLRVRPWLRDLRRVLPAWHSLACCQPQQLAAAQTRAGSPR